MSAGAGKVERAAPRPDAIFASFAPLRFKRLDRPAGSRRPV